MEAHSDVGFIAEPFPPASEAEWRRLVQRALDGRPFESLVSKSFEGLEIAPLYLRPTSEGARALRQKPGAWKISQRMDHPEPETANQMARADLIGGADALTLRRALFSATDSLRLTGVLLRILDRAQVIVPGPKPAMVLRSHKVRIDRAASDPFTTHEVLAELHETSLGGKSRRSRVTGAVPKFGGGLRQPFFTIASRHGFWKSACYHRQHCQFSSCAIRK